VVTTPSGPATGDTPWYTLRPFGRSAFASAFTRPGFRRFAEWVIALASKVEEHTITQSVLAIERIDDWKAMERLAE
jgi:hypothetical protein